MNSVEAKAFVQIPSFEDPRLGGVELRLEQQPDLKDQLGKLFSTPQNQVTSDVIGLRTEDIVPFLDSISRGRLPTGQNKQGKSLFYKNGGQGWYYLTPVYSNQFFDENPQYRKKFYSDQKMPLEKLARIQHHTYKNVPRVNAFTFTMEPYLQEDWWQKADEKLKSYRINNDRIQILTPEKTKEVVRENFCGLLFEELESHLLFNTERTLNILSDFEIISDLLKWMKPNNSNLEKLIPNHLALISIARRGIQIGFNRNITRNRQVQTDGYRFGSVIHEDLEMAVHAPHGITNPLDSIAYIEPMGDFEEKVLKRLGIK